MIVVISDHGWSHIPGLSNSLVHEIGFGSICEKYVSLNANFLYVRVVHLIKQMIELIKWNM